MHRVLINPHPPPHPFLNIVLYSNLLQHKIYNSYIIKVQQHKHIASYINQLYNNTINIMLVHVTPKIYHRNALVDHCTLLYQRRYHLGIYKLLYFPKPKLLAYTLVSLTAASRHQWRNKYWLLHRNQRMFTVKS